MFRRLLPFADGSAGRGKVQLPPLRHYAPRHLHKIPADDQRQAICVKCRMKEWNDAFSRSFKLSPGVEGA